MNKKLKIYLDTSVINFLFSEQSPEKREITIEFFENYLDLYEVYISEIVITEIEKTKDESKKSKLFQAIEKFNLEIYNNLNSSIQELSEIYIGNGIIPEKKIEDALHVAFCVFYEFDILLSWNFRHLANINKQDKINTVSLSNGYRKQLLLLNPMEVIYE
jgi:predicted nucleic acid-binding protein